ncbi:hypothetical protein [Rhodococcus sp. NPDC127528]|uniref:hypothetical protein n=1 Tax=unclassified Rhodococcus (in: high G+C Gram-positive bacteria) TaxID=192944 RepID=UPI00362619FF
MTDSERLALALLHADGDPEVLARLRQVPEWAEELDGLERVVAEIRALRKS